MDTSSDSLDKELGIKYPCKWEYKLITNSIDYLKKYITKLLKDRDYEFYFSKKSKKGTYDSYVLIVNVYSDQDRKQIYESLKQNDYVKIII